MPDPGVGPQLPGCPRVGHGQPNGRPVASRQTRALPVEGHERAFADRSRARPSDVQARPIDTSRLAAHSTTNTQASVDPPARDGLACRWSTATGRSGCDHRSMHENAGMEES